MAVPMSQWAADILAALGAPQTQNNRNNLAAWQACEGGDSLTRNNPFNTTLNAPGATGAINSAGVQGYDSYAHGLQATLATVRGNAYTGIVSALRADAPRSRFAAAVGNSPWGTSGSCIAGSAVSAGAAAPSAQAAALTADVQKGGGQQQAAGLAGSKDPACAWGLGGSVPVLSSLPIIGRTFSVQVCVIKKTTIRHAVGGLLIGAGFLVVLPGVVIVLAYGFRASGAAAAVTNVISVLPAGRAASASTQVAGRTVSRTAPKPARARQAPPAAEPKVRTGRGQVSQDWADRYGTAGPAA